MATAECAGSRRAGGAGGGGRIPTRDQGVSGR
nr:MAG TPA: hypothetical protein [Caudoviricetes sp.]